MEPGLCSASPGWYSGWVSLCEYSVSLLEVGVLGQRVFLFCLCWAASTCSCRPVIKVVRGRTLLLCAKQLRPGESCSTVVLQKVRLRMYSQCCAFLVLEYMISAVCPRSFKLGGHFRNSCSIPKCVCSSVLRVFVSVLSVVYTGPLALFSRPPRGRKLVE